PVLVDAGRQRNRLKEIDAGAREQRQPVQRCIHAGDVRADLLGVLVQTFALGPARRIGAQPLRKLFLQKGLELIAAALVRLKVEVQTDNWKGTRVGGSEAVELSGELIDVGHGLLA